MNQQDSGVEIVRGCLTEGGDSILGAFFCEPLRNVRAHAREPLRWPRDHYFLLLFSEYTNSRY